MPFRTRVHATAVVLTAGVTGSLAAGGLTPAQALATPTTAVQNAAAQTATSHQRAGAVAAPTAVTAKVARRRVDVDGDRRADSLTLTTLRVAGERHTFRLAVRTAKGARASVVHAADYPYAYGEPVDPKGVLWGTAPFDGVRGNDIVLDDGSSEDCVNLRVYTWRKGRLTVLPAPDNRINAWGWCIDDFGPRGMTFGYSKGRRTITAHDLSISRTNVNRVGGRHRVYVWTSRGWKQISTSRPVSYTRDVARNRYWKFHGIKIR